MQFNSKGSYALVFHCSHTVVVEAGGLGSLGLTPGYYIYCGSAFGPGGVRARTAHHRAISRSPHWHLDYLRPELELLEIWFTFDSQRREHQWANKLSELKGARLPFEGFGASDCGCRSHLIRLGYKPSFRAFRRRLRMESPDHKPFYIEKLT